MLLTVIIYGVMTLFGAVIVALAQLPSLFTLPPTPGRAAASVALALALTALVVRGGRRLESYDWYARMADLLGRLARRLLGPGAGTTEALIIALASSIGEEALFRGAVQPWLIRLALERLLDPAPAAVALGVFATTALFTLLHAPLHRDLRPWTAFAFLIGLAFGGLAVLGGSLLPAVLAHLLINFLNLRRLALEAPPPARAA